MWLCASAASWSDSPTRTWKTDGEEGDDDEGVLLLIDKVLPSSGVTEVGGGEGGGEASTAVHVGVDEIITTTTTTTTTSRRTTNNIVPAGVVGGGDVGVAAVWEVVAVKGPPTMPLGRQTHSNFLQSSSWGWRIISTLPYDRRVVVCLWLLCAAPTQKRSPQNNNKKF